ncbi:MAG: hypothetical protein ABEJ28_08590 [Salinigranum sp.]
MTYEGTWRAARVDVSDLRRRARRAGRRTYDRVRGRLRTLVDDVEPDVERDGGAPAARSPRYLCRTCGTTFDVAVYACPECGGATVEPIPNRNSGSGDGEIIENPGRNT